MSRIHDALKKAELERGVATAPPSSAGFPLGDFRGMADRPNPALAAMAAVGANPVTGDLASPLGFEVLAARCVEREWKPEAGTLLFTNGNESKRGAEEYRTLRSRLYHMREKTPLRKLLVTSALPKEGKSFTAANLAQVMVRQHGRRALLIDADLRMPRLHEVLGTTPNPGLTDFLQGKGDEFAIMQRGAIENLFFIPSGNPVPDAAALVGNGRLKLLLQRLEPLFDWIILDSPPVIPVSDASVLAQFCDGVLLVVRSNSTPSDVARKAREEFPEEALVGVVLNGTSENTDPYSRYYYGEYHKETPTAGVRGGN